MPFRETDSPFICTLRPLTSEEIAQEMSEIPSLADEIEVTSEDIENAKSSVSDDDYARACVAAYQRNMSIQDYVHAAFEAFDTTDD